MGHIGHEGPEEDCLPCRFLRARQALGLTQAQAAELLSRKPLCLNRWERGRRPVDPLALAYLENAG